MCQGFEIKKHEEIYDDSLDEILRKHRYKTAVESSIESLALFTFHR